MRGRFPDDVTDAQLIAFVDGWVALLDRRDYEGAYAYTDHSRDDEWTAESIREVIESYGDAAPGQRVTTLGTETPCREITRRSINARGELGEIWYDLNVSGRASDLTATFALVSAPAGGIHVCLRDIHVM